MLALPEAALARIQALLQSGQRRLLGIAGPPGSGKSTVAAALHAAFANCSVIVPMDGFHLAQRELERLGRAARKGAPDTFDAAGFIALLQRLRTPQPAETIYAPEFRREIEEPIACALPVSPEIPLVIVEGNYLLLAESPWCCAHSLFDETWYIEVDQELRLQRLITRHIQFGRSPEAAAEWVMRSDEANARLIEAAKERADWVLRV